MVMARLAPAISEAEAAVRRRSLLAGLYGIQVGSFMCPSRPERPLG